MAFAALLLASLGTSGTPEARADLPLKVKVTPTPVGPLAPGATFTVNITVENVLALHAYQIKVSWNMKILRADNASNGPFLSTYKPTYFTYIIGVAGESVTMAELIISQDWRDGSGTLAHIGFTVMGGGKTDIVLEEVRLEDVDGNLIYWDSLENGLFWSDWPYIDFKWYVATAEDGVRAHAHWVLGGTMYYGDNIMFDSSGSYDLAVGPGGVPVPAPLDPSAFKWVIRAGGMDKYYRYSAKGKLLGIYDFRYETGANASTDELGPGAQIIYYTFPGALPMTYSLYGASHLGWHDLEVSVTDSDNQTATYYTWIRIFRLSPARTVMETKTTSSYHLSEQGVTYGYKMYFYGKVQNRGGTGTFPEETLTTYLELARMVKGSFWAGMQFTIKSLSGKPTKTLVTPAAMMYNETVGELAPTETPIYPQGPAVWEDIGEGDVGYYTCSAKGMICGSGATYGLPATGTIVKSFVIKP